MYLIINVIFFGLLTYLFLRKNTESFGYWPLLNVLFKCAMAMAVGFFYLYPEQNGDTWDILNKITNFNESNSGSFTSYVKGLFMPINSYNPRSIFFVRLFSPVGLLSNNNYWIIGSYCALFSTWCTWVFIKEVSARYPKQKLMIILIFGFFPSFHFWSSGLLKDTVVNGCFFFICATVIKIIDRLRINYSSYVLSMVLFGFLIMLRHYIAGIALIIILIIGMDSIAIYKGRLYRVFSFLGICALGGYIIRFFFIRLRPERFPLTFYELHEQILANTTAGSIININLAPTWASILQNTPLTLVTGLFRPFIWEASNWLMLLQSLESITLMALFMWSSILLIKNKKMPSISPLLLGMGVFIVVLATILPFVTPNFGSLSRYSCIYKPFLAFILVQLPMSCSWKPLIRC